MLMYFIMFVALGAISTFIVDNTWHDKLPILWISFILIAGLWGMIHEPYWGIIAFIELAIGGGAAIAYTIATKPKGEE